jgi:hypothetical protein
VVTGIAASSSVELGSFQQVAAGTVTGAASITGTSSQALDSVYQASAGLVTTPSIAGDVVKTPSGSVLANFTIPKVTFLRVSDMTPVLQLTNQTTNGSGLLSISSTSFVPGARYIRVFSDANGDNVGVKTFTAV